MSVKERSRGGKGKWIIELTEVNGLILVLIGLSKSRGWTT